MHARKRPCAEQGILRMEALHKVSRVVRALASLVAPRFCAVCGEAVGATDRWPLCARCSDAVLAEGRALVAPGAEHCRVCGKLIVSERGRCMRCRGVEYCFDSAWPLFRYAGTVRALVLAYKSGRRRSLALFFAGIVAEALAVRYPGRIVIPVPPRPGKVRRKGWDQVEDLARILERRHGVTVMRILTRADGEQQKTLDLEGRASNMRGKIGIVCSGHGRPRAVPADPVLLDDVLTTGATLSECARALKAAGSERVDAVVMAAD